MQVSRRFFLTLLGAASATAACSGSEGAAGSATGGAAGRGAAGAGGAGAGAAGGAGGAYAGGAGAQGGATAAGGGRDAGDAPIAEAGPGTEAGASPDAAGSTPDVSGDPVLDPSKIDVPGSGTKVIWLEGSGCSGCSISFLNRVASQAPETAADVLMDIVVVGYHPVLMAASGELAVAAAERVYRDGKYLLVVEGGVPTAWGGGACQAWTWQGKDETFLDVVTRYAAQASSILCVGDCAAWGGASAAAPNLTGVKGVQDATGKKTINVPGCPPHPDWIVWTLAQVLAGANVALDSSGRPTALFGSTVHQRCLRQTLGKATRYGVDNQCLMNLGCKGPNTRAPCPMSRWNGGTNWCVDANAPCIGCTEPTFPAVGLWS